MRKADGGTEVICSTDFSVALNSPDEIFDRVRGSPSVLPSASGKIGSGEGGDRGLHREDGDGGEENIFYGFSIAGDQVFCREGYADAEGLLAHLENVAPVLKEMLKVSEVARVEVHGPAAELEKLKGPMADLKPVWFANFEGKS